MRRRLTRLATLAALAFASACASAPPMTYQARFHRNLRRPPSPLLCHIAQQGILAAHLKARCGFERRGA